MLEGLEPALDQETFSLALHRGRKVVLLTRKAAGRVGAIELEQGLRSILDRVTEPTRWGILFDTRAVVGRSDPEFERDAKRLREFMLDRFRCVAVLVRSMAGEMQVQRLADSGERMLVFRELEHAMAFAAGEIGSGWPEE